MIKNNDYPSQKELRDIFTYENGVLYWNISKSGVNPNLIAGHIKEDDYILITINQKTFTRNRLIWIYFNGDIPNGYVIDHINHLKNDDRIENLQMVTQYENRLKSLKNKNNTSGYKGVYYSKADLKYRARISINGKRISLGLFKCPTLAAIHYDKAAKKFHGKFAVLNFP